MLDPSVREKLRLNIQFVCFAHTEGKMYYDRDETYIAKGLGSHGNSVVYGAIYSVYDDYFYFRTLDAMHNCSLSSMGRNSPYDRQHRIRSPVTIIQFSSLDEFSRLKYKELDTVEVDMYVANVHHPTIKPRIEQTQKYNFRIKDGFTKDAFIAQFKEE